MAHEEKGAKNAKTKESQHAWAQVVICEQKNKSEQKLRKISKNMLKNQVSQALQEEHF